MPPLGPNGKAELNPVDFIRNNWLFLSVTLLLVVLNCWLLASQNQGDALVAINELRSPVADVFFKIGTHFAEPVAYATIILLVGAFSWRKSMFAVVSGALAGIVAGIFKAIFAQPRPMRWFYDNHNDIWHALNRFEEEWMSWDEVSSFPSGHTASAFALYGFLSFNARGGKSWIALLCTALAIMVGFSRMYLMYHFLRDVTAGALLGVLMGILAYYLQDKVFRNSSLLDRGWADRFRTLPPIKAKVEPPA